MKNLVPVALLSLLGGFSAANLPSLHVASHDGDSEVRKPVSYYAELPAGNHGTGFGYATIATSTSNLVITDIVALPTPYDIQLTVNGRPVLAARLGDDQPSIHFQSGLVVPAGSVLRFGVRGWNNINTPYPLTVCGYSH